MRRERSMMVARSWQAAIAVALVLGAGCYDYSLNYYPNFYEMTYGNGLYVAVAEEGVIARSTDGKHWSLSPAGVTTDLHCVTFFKGVFVVGSKDGPLLWSPDAVVWTKVPGWDAGLRDFVTCGDTLWAVGDDGTIASTPDGMNWQVRHSGSAWLWRVACSDNTIVAVEGGSDGVLRSVDGGQTWTRTFLSNASHCGLTFALDLFVSVSIVGDVYTSSDAVSWTLTAEAIWEADLNVPCGLAWNGEFFAMVNWKGYLYVSEDAQTWTALSYPDMGEFTLVDLWPKEGGFTAVGAGEFVDINCSGGTCSASKPRYISVPWPDWIPTGGNTGTKCGGTTCATGEVCVSSRSCINGAYSCECAGSTAGQCVDFAAHGFDVHVCGDCGPDYTACCPGEVCVNGTCYSASELPAGCTAQ
ncbi:MAG TPA: hypothetical protein VM425_16055 [Myxococcota bacterium]|nr:hypothetical protein [Myxococcota bacterium]